MEKFLIDKNTAWNTRAPNFSLNLNPCVPSSVLPSVLLLPLRRRWALWEGHCRPRHIQFHLRRRGLLVKRWCILRLLRRRRLRFFELRWLRVAGISSDCTDDSSFSSQVWIVSSPDYYSPRRRKPQTSLWPHLAKTIWVCTVWARGLGILDLIRWWHLCLSVGSRLGGLLLSDALI